MIRILGCTFVSLSAAGPVALIWWGLDDAGSSPFALLAIAWFAAFALWPEPRRGRNRTTRSAIR